MVHRIRQNKDKLKISKIQMILMNIVIIWIVNKQNLKVYFQILKINIDNMISFMVLWVQLQHKWIINNNFQIKTFHMNKIT